MKPIAKSTNSPDQLVFKETLTLLEAIGEYIASKKPPEFGSQTEFNLSDLNRALIDTVSQVFHNYTDGNGANLDEGWVGLRDKWDILKGQIHHKDLQAFFDLSPEEFARLIGIGDFDNKESISNHATDIIENLKLIKESSEAQFEQEEIKRWLHSPNPVFDNKTPIDVMVAGELERVLDIFIQLEEGIHN